ncbi:MAG: hypothetical protein ACI8P0_002785 [Planctomycetaceae bacterium]
MTCPSQASSTQRTSLLPLIEHRSSATRLRGSRMSRRDSDNDCGTRSTVSSRGQSRVVCSRFCSLAAREMRSTVALTISVSGSANIPTTTPFVRVSWGCSPSLIPQTDDRRLMISATGSANIQTTPAFGESFWPTSHDSLGRPWPAIERNQSTGSANILRTRMCSRRYSQFLLHTAQPNCPNCSPKHWRRQGKRLASSSLLPPHSKRHRLCHQPTPPSLRAG